MNKIFTMLALGAALAFAGTAGMVAPIQVGNRVNLDEANAVKQTGKAKAAFADLFGRTLASN